MDHVLQNFNVSESTLVNIIESFARGTIGSYGENSDLVSAYMGSEVIDFKGKIPRTKEDDTYSYCSDAELHFLGMFYRRLFDPDFGKGFFVHHRNFNVPLGVIKISGEGTFLSFVTVRDSSGRYPLVRGGVYRTPHEVINRLPFHNGRGFKGIEIDNLDFRFGRLLNVHSHTYSLPKDQRDIDKVIKTSFSNVIAQEYKKFREKRRTLNFRQGVPTLKKFCYDELKSLDFPDKLGLDLSGRALKDIREQDIYVDHDSKKVYHLLLKDQNKVELDSEYYL